MVNMNMGGPVGAPMPMMNNGGVVPPGAQRQLQVNENNRTLLNTYIYEYFLRYGMYDAARAILNSDSQVKVLKDSPNGRRDENGNLLGNGAGDDPMDTDSKEDMESKRPEDLPAPNVPMPLPDSCFLYEWFCLFWDMFNAQKGKGGSGQVNQYVSHTQQQSRMRQAHQQDMLRQMRPEFTQQQYQQQMMRNMQNGAAMNLNMKQGNNLPRTAMANSQNNPQAMQMLQQKQGQMQRDPSDMDGNRARPASPGSGDSVPSPSKRPRLEGAPFNPQQAGMMPNGRPAGQGMPGQPVGAQAAQVHQMLIQNGIDPSQLNPEQFQTFQNQSPAVQQKTIQTYAQNLQQHHGAQMGNKPMPNAAPGPQGQGSPMVPQGPDGAALNAYYNAGEMAAAGAMRPGAPGANQAAGGSNHALQDYQMQLMLLEQQNKKRLMMARQEQDGMAMPRADGQGGPAGPVGPNPQGPNGQPFQGASPQGPRAGASPNPSEQMKRAGQMNPVNMGSPLPEGAQSRGSPNAINFMGAQMDPSTAPHFFKDMNGMGGNMAVAAQMNGMRPPHPGQPFNGPMNQQQMMAARQQQQAAAQGNPQMQWQQAGPNGQQMAGPPGQQGPQVQGTPQQRSMPPPAQPQAAANAAANARNTSSPQVSTAAPPTPSQGNKAAPKKKESKAAKDKRAATQKKSNSNLNAGATPAAAEAAPEQEPPTPATPITPVNPQSFNKGQNAAPAQVIPNGQPAAPAPPVAAPMPPQPQPDPNQNNAYGMGDGGLDFGSMDFANPLTSTDVLDSFDFDSFLHDNEGDPGAFDFNAGAFAMEGGEIGAE